MEIPLDCGHRLGSTFIAQAGLFSAVTVIVFLLYLAYTQVRNARYGGTGKWQYALTAHVNIYFLGLLVADFFQTLGPIMNIRWVALGRIENGHYCVAQGAIKQIGPIAVALTTLAIALDTFAILFYRWNPPKSPLIPIMVLTFIWVFVSLVAGVGYAVHKNAPHEEPYYGIVGYWCLITKDYQKERVGLFYCWLWGSVLLNILLYIALFFKLRGNIKVNGLFSMELRRLEGNQAWTRAEDPHGNLARTMLWYPAIYVVSALPLSLTRWLAYTRGENKPPEFPPYAATVFSACILYLSGFFNVLLYTITRPGLRPVQTQCGPSALTLAQETAIEGQTKEQKKSELQEGSGTASPRKRVTTEPPQLDDTCLPHLHASTSQSSW